jgi:hypothetical protein
VIYLTENKKPREKQRNFFNDADGFTDRDLEKILMLGLTCITVIISLIMYIIYLDISPNLIYLNTALLTATVARKGLSYIKPDRYYGTNASSEQITANNQQNQYGNMYGSSMGYDPYSTGMYNQNGYIDPTMNGSVNMGLNVNVPAGTTAIHYFNNACWDGYGGCIIHL